MTEHDQGARNKWMPLKAGLTILFAALLITLPLLLRGPSCGHDFDFHVGSWLDAAAQMRHGTLDPQWAFTPAWNAGEPRFVFYPPLSWMLGALLSMALPLKAVPFAITWIALSAAGLAMFRLTRAFVPQPVALLSSIAYLANPYMLFTALERTAYAELLAAAWLPLLLLAAFEARPTLRGIALPVALLWLTNAPAAVIGCYAFALVIALRLLLRSGVAERRLRWALDPHRPSAARLLAMAAGGTSLGLALPAFYLLPAAFERRYVQIAMAIIPNMRYADNFLFGGTGDLPHDAVLRTASWLSVFMLSAVAVLLVAVLLAPAAFPRSEGAPSKPHKIPDTNPRLAAAAAAVLAGAIALLLTRFSAPLWRILPELAFLQFPWRLLSLAGVLLGLALALALRRVRLIWPVSAGLGLGFVVLAVTAGTPRFRQPCERTESPSTHAQLLTTGHGDAPTDEYTPTDADNDVLRWDDPAFWLSTQANAPAPGTVPNPAATIVNYDIPPPLQQTISGRAPTHLHLDLAGPEDLILNLRAYPAWIVSRDGTPLQPLGRDDGLLAVSLPRGHSDVEIAWHNRPDRDAGIAISCCAVLALGADWRRSRKMGG